MSPLLTALLMGLRANCEATICAIDIYLVTAKANDDNQKLNEEKPPPPPPVTDASAETCQHPNLIHAPVMGNQGRFICANSKCGAEVQK